jgi:hypothetical protein
MNIDTVIEWFDSNVTVLTDDDDEDDDECDDPEEDVDSTVARGSEIVAEDVIMWVLLSE